MSTSDREPRSSWILAYNAPTAKVAVMPTFRIVVVFNPQIDDIGRMRMTKSLTMLAMQLAIYTVCMWKQVPGSAGVHTFRTGMQMKILSKVDAV